MKEQSFFNKCGDDGKKDTPVPISNTEVKLLSADSSWGFPPARVGRRHAQDRKFKQKCLGFFCLGKLRGRARGA